MTEDTPGPKASRAQDQFSLDPLAVVLGLVLMIPGAIAPVLLLRLGWVNDLQEIGFPQNHWLFVGPMILVMLTAYVSSLAGQRRAARYSVVILMQAAWYMGAAMLAGVLLAAAGIRPTHLPSVALLLFLSAPGFLAGIAMLRQWGVVQPRRREPSDRLDIEICAAVTLPGILLVFAMIDFLQDSGVVSELPERHKDIAGIIVLPVFFALFGARPVTRRHWAVLAGTIVGIAILCIAVWALATAALAALSLGETVRALTASLPAFLPVILAGPALIATRRLAGPDGPWPRDPDPEAEETAGGAAR